MFGHISSFWSFAGRFAAIWNKFTSYVIFDTAVKRKDDAVTTVVNAAKDPGDKKKIIDS